ncbi:Per1-like family protein [Zea mays]|uniref:Post-GPI attachment to proteins factor 3 n=1 Tax=Zea mays TaxID=4577 RepID=A0A1D6FUL2_MAIZE|nr:Per1-like family protein [Zea mays]
MIQMEATLLQRVRIFTTADPSSNNLRNLYLQLSLRLLLLCNLMVAIIFLLLYYKLPLRPETHKTYYEYTGLWHIYGLLAMNSWFWSAIYHSCDTIWTEKLYFSSDAAFLGYSLILTILRTSSLRDEASRVMVAAPILAFVTTHIMYLNFYELDKGNLGHDH